VKEFAKIVGLPQILKLPMFAGHPSSWQMFVYSIFSNKNKLRDVCRLPIEDREATKHDLVIEIETDSILFKEKRKHLSKMSDRVSKMLKRKRLKFGFKRKES
jgi:hypothetical protein